MMYLILAIVAIVLLAYGGYYLYEKDESKKNMAYGALVLGLLSGAGAAYCYSECKDM